MPIVLLIPPLLTETVSAIPTVATNPTYTGSAVSPTWNNYDTNQLQIGGTYSATTAGTYTATFTPKDGYEWSDETTTIKSVNWTINKAKGSLSLNKTSVNLNNMTKSTTVSVTRAGNGVITASSSNTSIATVSLSGTTLTITGIASGSCTITVKVAAGTNHTAPSNKTITVNSNIISDLASASWSSIAEVAENGTADSYFDIGDEKIIAYKYNNIAYNVPVRIVAFNHHTIANDSKKAGITFMFARMLDNIQMSTIETNWQGVSTYGRTYTNNTVYNQIQDSTLKNKIKYVQLITGRGSNSTETVTTTTERIFLPSCRELIGNDADTQRIISETATRRLSVYPCTAFNEGEQFEYFALGNSIGLPFIDGSNPSTAISVDNFYWTRSPAAQVPSQYADTRYTFIGPIVYTKSNGELDGYARCEQSIYYSSGSINYTTSAINWCTMYGYIAPCFCI